MCRDFQSESVVSLKEYTPILKIKQLTWENVKIDKNGYYAQSPFGEYCIRKFQHVVGVDYSVYFSGPCIKNLSSLEEAKEWCQGEYERRIRECLE